MHPRMNTTLKIVGAFTEVFYVYTVPRMNHRGDIRPALRKRRKSKRRVEGIHTATPKGIFPLFKFWNLCKRMVFPASVRNAHPFVRVKRQIGRVKPSCWVSNRRRGQKLVKVIKSDSPVKIWIAEGTCWGSIERSGIAPVQDSDSLRCHVAYSHGPENNQHCEGNT